jgi:hypothetical protein
MKIIKWGRSPRLTDDKIYFEEFDRLKNEEQKRNVHDTGIPKPAAKTKSRND